MASSMSVPLSKRLICLCGEPRLAKSEWLSFRNGRCLYRCIRCGMRQLAPYPVATNVDSSIYSKPGYLGAITDDEYFGYFRALYDRVLVELITPSSRVLDFGAGTCHYAHFLQNLGFSRVYSLEINPHLAQVARERFGLERVVSRFAELPGEPFDLVYANQVLEHIYNPLDLINGPIAERIAPGGHLVFTVPNFDSLNRSLLRQLWIGYSPEEHIWFFSEKSVRWLFAKSTIYDVRKLEVHSAINTPHDRFRPRNAIKRAYYQTIMRAFEWIGRGDQLIVVLQRKQVGS